MKQKSGFIRWFDSIRMDDIDSVGGKNASIGELTHAFRNSQIKVPNGFAVTVNAYRTFLVANRIDSLLGDLFAGERVTGDPLVISKMGSTIRAAFQAGRIPDEVQHEIIGSYRELSQFRSGRFDVAVRSSATAEDLPAASFAGQQDTFLNVDGESALLEAVVRCFGSLYNDRAISYRSERGFGQKELGISVSVQEMIRSDLGSAGVMFTLDPESGFRDLVVINSSYGLGESVVKGNINPDEYLVYKKTLQEGFRPIIRRQVGTKEKMLVYNPLQGAGLLEVETDKSARERLSLQDEEVLELARAGIAIENHYSRQRGKDTPMDIEWAKDGLNGQLYIVQARPETVHSQAMQGKSLSMKKYFMEEAGPVLVRGRSVGVSIRVGKARVIEHLSDLNELKDSEILVTEKTDPDWEPVLKRATAIVTNQGGRTCHAAIVARELGIPAVVGTRDGTRVIKTGEWISVSTAEGDEGRVYSGVARFRVEESKGIDLSSIKTKVMLNLGRSDQAFELSELPNSGVGLARMEFMISSGVGVHPLALIHFDQISDSACRERIVELTRGYPDRESYYVGKLSEQIGCIAAAFYPKPVILRMSDFKSSEYGNLLGGSQFEKPEENPMIGFRGAFRYSNPLFSEGFRLECEAVKKVRLEMGLTNLKIMIPFVRTLPDSINAINELKKNGLKRGEANLEIWMMCEVPSNIIMAERFLEHYDGFSIGSNDLTQLLLGVDRDSEILSPLFNENDPAVIEMIKRVIGVARKMGKPIGICGQAPSDYPEYARFLVEEGISSMSLNPDSVLKVLGVIEETERRIFHE